jgi:hypothetical protein
MSPFESRRDPWPPTEPGFAPYTAHDVRRKALGLAREQGGILTDWRLVVHNTGARLEAQYLDVNGVACYAVTDL